MGANTEIGWCDATFNPWWGCMKVSDGCANCYAVPIATRRGLTIWGPPATTPRRLFSPTHWTEPRRWNRKAVASGLRQRVFCASMADVFEAHPEVMAEREHLWEVIAETTALDWMLLTKRPEHVNLMVPDDWYRDGWPERVWIGVSAEDQVRADERIPVLLEVPAAIRFVSVEPLLGPVDLSPWLGDLGWVIVGGETGPSHRRMTLSWLEDIVEQCRAANVPVFVKQDSGWRPGKQGRIPDSLWSLKQSPPRQPAL